MPGCIRVVGSPVSHRPVRMMYREHTLLSADKLSVVVRRVRIHSIYFFNPIFVVPVRSCNVRRRNNSGVTATYRTTLYVLLLFCFLLRAAAAAVGGATRTNIEICFHSVHLEHATAVSVWSTVHRTQSKVSKHTEKEFLRARLLHVGEAYFFWRILVGIHSSIMYIVATS